MTNGSPPGTDPEAGAHWTTYQPREAEPGNDSGPGGDQGPPNAVIYTAKRMQDGTTELRPNCDPAVYRHLDREFVRESFRRSWDPEIRRLRRLLREAG